MITLTPFKFVAYTTLGWQFIFFQHFKYIIPLFWSAKFCWEILCYSYKISFICDQALFPCCFQILSLSVTFDSFTVIYLSVSLFRFIPLVFYWASLNCMSTSFLKFGKFLAMISSNRHSTPFFHSPETPIMHILFHFQLSYNNHRLFSLLFFSSDLNILNNSSSSLLILSSTWSNLLIVCRFWIVQFSYCILELQNFVSLLFSSLYLFINILLLFMHCSLDFV